MIEVDYRLCLVTNRSLLKAKSLQEAVLQAVQGGATMVQLREKDASSREFYLLACSLQQILRPLGIPLIINDRLDIAMGMDADGLHLGQDDLPLEAVRRLWGPEKIIGFSIGTIDQALQGAREGASYLGIGPVFRTPTKPDAGPATGLELLKQVKKRVELPGLAIGGVNLNNLDAVKKTGIDGVAVVSALLHAENIKAAAQRMVEKWNAS